MLALREYVSQVGSLDEKDVNRLTLSRRHFEDALQRMKPRSPEELRRYPSLAKDLRSGPPYTA
ncbi:MAG: hypothetical protein HY557_02405 [Euryarchaeota archaeon]|nr:hypothetical protein [Euryarchaeota archaeon]